MEARDCSTAFRSSGRPSVSLTRPLTVALAQTLADAAHRPLLQHRALLDPEDQDQPVPDGALLHQHVVELAGAEQGRDGPLDVAVVDRLVRDEPGGADDLGRGEPRIPHDGDAVDGGRLFGSWAEQRRRAPQQEGHGGEPWRGNAASALGRRWARRLRAEPARAGLGLGAGQRPESQPLAVGRDVHLDLVARDRTRP